MLYWGNLSIVRHFISVCIHVIVSRFVSRVGNTNQLGEQIITLNSRHSVKLIRVCFVVIVCRLITIRLNYLTNAFTHCYQLSSTLYQQPVSVAVAGSCRYRLYSISLRGKFEVKKCSVKYLKPVILRNTGLLGLYLGPGPNLKQS